MRRLTAVFAALLLTLMLSGAAFASSSSYIWYFASTSGNLWGTGTLTAIPDGSGTPGLYDITGGGGTITQNGVATAVSIAACPNYAATCTLVNTDGLGLNLFVDNLLYLNHSVGSYLDQYGIAFTPGPAGTSTSYINIYDAPSQYLYTFGSNAGNQDLSHPFDIVPEPSSLTLLGTGMVGLAGLLRRRMGR